MIPNLHFELRDAIDETYPRAYCGSDPRFTVVKEFGGRFEYRVLKVNPFVHKLVVEPGEGRR